MDAFEGTPMTWESIRHIKEQCCPRNPGLAGLALKTTPTLCVRLTDFMMEVGYRTAGEATWNMIPSGYVQIAIEHGPFIVDLPIKAGDFP